MRVTECWAHPWKRELSSAFAFLSPEHSKHWENQLWDPVRVALRALPFSRLCFRYVLEEFVFLYKDVTPLLLYINLFPLLHLTLHSPAISAFFLGKWGSLVGKRQTRSDQPSA